MERRSGATPGRRVIQADNSRPNTNSRIYAMHNALHNGLARYLSPDQLEALRAAAWALPGRGGLAQTQP